MTAVLPNISGGLFLHDLFLDDEIYSKLGVAGPKADSEMV